jgi:hypothetical protein
VAEQAVEPATPICPVPLRIGRVNSLRGARRALVRVTNAVLSGRIDPRIANSAIYGLSNVGRMLEVEILETRLLQLEERAGINKRRPVLIHSKAADNHA